MSGFITKRHAFMTVTTTFLFYIRRPQFTSIIFEGIMMFVYLLIYIIFYVNS